MYENMQKHISFKFLPCLVLKICRPTFINTFQFGGGGHIGFLNFEAFAAIFELGIQKSWAQHPSIPHKKLVSPKLTRFVFRTLNKHIISQIMPSLII